MIHIYFKVLVYLNMEANMKFSTGTECRCSVSAEFVNNLFLIDENKIVKYFR